VLLIDKGPPHLQYLGEFLSPPARAALNRMQILDAGWEAGHAAAHEFASCWGSANPSFRNYLFDPHGHALVLNRAGFDKSLTAAALASGAMLLRGTHLVSARRSADRWKLTMVQGQSLIEAESSLLILCGGRSGNRVRGLHASRRRLDKLVCFAMRLGRYDGDCRPFVETYGHGWVYSVGLPSGELMINLFTESDRNSHRRIGKSLDFLLAEIAQCPIACSRVLRSNPGSGEQAMSVAADASSAYARPAAGAGWCLAGDHAQSMDPLSSGGIAQALQHADLVSKAITRSSSLGAVEFDEYASHLDKTYAAYLAGRAEVYGLERRWQTPFWLRRSDPRRVEALPAFA
jgi:2-polyprenyl-6-methoxyphenol hydroxylase-like FAD-dependent oxidoreductase